MMLGTPLLRHDATIEDLIPRNVYVNAVQRTGRAVTLSNDELQIPMNVRAMESVFQRLGLGNFGIAEKTAAALVLLDDWAKDVNAVQHQVIENARVLITAINDHFAS
jgi:uncharacterized protein (UPF0147 family)